MTSYCQTGHSCCSTDATPLNNCPAAARTHLPTLYWTSVMNSPFGSCISCATRVLLSAALSKSTPSVLVLLEARPYVPLTPTTQPVVMLKYTQSCVSCPRSLKRDSCFWTVKDGCQGVPNLTVLLSTHPAPVQKRTFKVQYHSEKPKMLINWLHGSVNNSYAVG